MEAKIGDLLVKRGRMTRSQVDNVLRIQRAGYQYLFAEIAIELGYLEDYSPKSFADFLAEPLARHM